MAQKIPKKSKTMIWTEFLKSTSKPIKPDHPPAKPAQSTRPPKPINGRLTDGLSMNLFSTDGQRIYPIPDPNPPLPLTLTYVPLGLSLLSHVESCRPPPLQAAIALLYADASLLGHFLSDEIKQIFKKKKKKMEDGNLVSLSPSTYLLDVFTKKKKEDK